MYNVVNTCAYGNTEDKVEQHNQWQLISEQLESQGVSDSKIEYERKIGILYRQNDFIFVIHLILKSKL